MSNLVHVAVMRRRVGSPALKTILAYMAERASDDGSGVWCSKGRIADETEFSKRTVIRSVGDLLAMGLIVEVGHKPCTNGFTVEYCLNLAEIEALPLASKGSDTVSPHPCPPDTPPVTRCHPTSDTVSPKPSLNHPGTIQESESPQSPPFAGHPPKPARKQPRRWRRRDNEPTPEEKEEADRRMFERAREFEERLKADLIARGIPLWRYTPPGEAATLAAGGSR